MFKHIPPKNFTEICSEWDTVCSIRQNAIDSGNDVSLTSVIAPSILKNVLQESHQSIIDVGCGTGYIASLLAKDSEICYGIDVSSKSISIAREKYASTGARFFNSSIAEFSTTISFDMCISNMALISDPFLYESLKKMYEITVPNGHLVIMITHPCFWPKYWGFQDENWFNYNNEVFIEHDFSISLIKSMGKTTYIHRPLSSYINGLTSVGFTIEKFEEPYPVGSVPTGYNYEYPRFLLIKCRK